MDNQHFSWVNQLFLWPFSNCKLRNPAIPWSQVGDLRRTQACTANSLQDDMSQCLPVGVKHGKHMGKIIGKSWKHIGESTINGVLELEESMNIIELLVFSSKPRLITRGKLYDSLCAYINPFVLLQYISMLYIYGGVNLKYFYRYVLQTSCLYIFYSQKIWVPIYVYLV